MQTGSRFIGFTAASRSLPVSMQRSRSTDPPSTRASDRPASSFHVRVASPELLRALTSAQAVSGRAACQGFLPSSRHHRGASTFARAPRASLRSVHRRSQPLDGLLRSPAPGLVPSPSRVQGVGSRSGASLPAQRLPPRRRARPPCRCRADARLGLAIQRPHRTTPRLRGFAPRGVAFTSGR